MCVCMYDLVACKVCYHVLVVTFPMPHDRGCEIKIIVIVIVIVFCKYFFKLQTVSETKFS